MRILVTGGTGSIGLPLSLALSAEGHEVTVIARSEYGHYLLRREDPRIRSVMLDIRHPDVLDYAASSDLVYNCAALKHVGFCEEHPNLAFMLNASCAGNIARAAPAMIQLSTDKAADPQTVLGHTKARAERLVLQASPQHRVVRLCNVLGSRGSLLETAAWQVATGRLITVTDQAATRYYISAGQAVGMLLAARGLPAGSLVVAEGRKISVGALLDEAGFSGHIARKIGLQHSEKLHEDLMSAAESAGAVRYYLESEDVYYYLLSDTSARQPIACSQEESAGPTTAEADNQSQDGMGLPELPHPGIGW